MGWGFGYLTKLEGTLEWYKDVKEELRKYGIPVDDIIRFTKAVRSISEQGYNTIEIIKTYSEYHTLRYATHNMEENLSVLEKEISGLEENKAALEKVITSYSQLLSQLQHLSMSVTGAFERPKYGYQATQAILRELKGQGLVQTWNLDQESRLTLVDLTNAGTYVNMLFLVSRSYKINF